MADRAAETRACREAFSLALTRNLTVAEARAALAKARWESTAARLSACRCGTRDDTPAPRAPADAPWMMRE